jgi:hypothetical protein
MIKIVNTQIEKKEIPLKYRSEKLKGSNIDKEKFPILIKKK